MTSVSRPSKRRSSAGLRSPLTVIVLTVGVLHAIGLLWGLPASDGWDNDGVAPRDFLPGLAATFTPGRFYTYPPLHLAVLAVATLPITLVGVLRAPSTALPALVTELEKVPYMTAYAVVARLLALAMSLGIVVAVARLTEEVRASALGLAPLPSRRWFEGHFDDPRVRRAGYCTAVFVGLDASLTYYGKTSNLDVPYLFWAGWAMLGVARALARAEPRRLRAAFVCAALAVTTKDQAYAMFVLSVPAILALGWIKDRALPLREIGVAAALALGVVVVVDGAVTNPSGFRARLVFLSGSASQDYVAYTADWSGRISVLVDGLKKADLHYPPLALVVVALGLVRSVRRRLGVWPLLVALSFTVAFNFTARRTDARFLLPQAVALSVYGGLGLEALVFVSRTRLRIAGQAFASLVVALGLFGCLAVDANLLHDPRYEAEAWLAANVRPGEVIETYGLNVYLPRMPAGVRVLRVGPEPLDKRNPLPGVEEVSAPYELAESRPATWIVVATGWAWRYFRGPPPDRGRLIQPTVERYVADEPTLRYFDALARSQTVFGFIHGSDYDAHLFPVMDIHGTTARTVWIYKRR